ncbi:MAG TPA: hypothetical protein VLA98_03225, partial [Solirubrobacteraceae bacterium]|nr:hypothetical protein [Solirubrobacteraceae bacterium]
MTATRGHGTTGVLALLLLLLTAAALAHAPRAAARDPVPSPAPQDPLPPTEPPEPPPPPRDPLVAAAGDIACNASEDAFAGGAGTARRCAQTRTSDLLLELDPTYVLPLGDEQYYRGTLEDFMASYDPSWGRLKAISRPAIGNHEYFSGGDGYFDYFNGPGVFSGPAGDRDKGYYSFDVGGWHLIALNS